jgi:hypothetical protein
MAAWGRCDDLSMLMQAPKAQPPAAVWGAPVAVQPTATILPPDNTVGTWISDTNVPRPAQTAATSAQRAYLPPLPMNAAYPQQPLPMSATYPPQQPPPMSAAYGQPAMPMYGPVMQAGMQQPMNGPGGQPMPPGPNYGPAPPQGSFEGAGPMAGPADASCPDEEEKGNAPGWFGGPDCVGLWNQSHLPQKFWARAEYLSFWTKGNPLPSLVTTSFPGTPQTQAGVLGQTATSTLFGNEKVDQSQRNGGRITVGYWFDEGQFNGIEGHYFALAPGGTSYSNSQSFSTNPDAMILARPFFNTQTAAQDSSLLAFPNFNLLGTFVNLNGTINVQTKADLQSAGMLFRHLMWVDFEGNYRMDLLTGYRFFKVDNSVAISDSTSTVGGFLAPTTFTAYDSFAARNTFNGGEIGFSSDYYWGRLSLNMVAKSAFGGVHEVVKINGMSTVTTLNTQAVTVGGLLAQPSNIGQYGRTEFAALPEVALNLRYDICACLRLVAGYNFMYLTRMQNSGTAIDTTVNPTQIGGTGVTAGTPNRPAFAFADTGFFAQGISAGLECRW